MHVDLHSHSTASDGLLSPADLVRRAAAHGVRTIALTDHDTMSGLPEAHRTAQQAGVSLIPGVELSARVPRGAMHLLGYFREAAPAALLGELARLAEGRMGRARLMVDRLCALGVPIAFEEVTAHARGTIGRPHLADALVAAGHVRSRADAFGRFLGDRGPAYIPSEGLTPREALAVVRAAGGVPVLAHPLTLALDRTELAALLRELADMGLMGVEVHRPDHDVPTRELLAGLADALGLFQGGGSDFHAPEGPVEPGDTGPSSPDVDALMALLASA